MLLNHLDNCGKLWAHLQMRDLHQKPKIMVHKTQDHQDLSQTLLKIVSLSVAVSACKESTKCHENAKYLKLNGILKCAQVRQALVSQLWDENPLTFKANYHETPTYATVKPTLSPRSLAWLQILIKLPGEVCHQQNKR